MSRSSATSLLLARANWATPHADARLIAAAPTMAAYIEKRAAEGDVEAKSIMEAIHGDA
jgi:hypothetical protein